jgi:hypothetical protein
VPRKAAGTPTGNATPSASRYLAASSIAIQRCSPPIRSATARREPSSAASHSPAADGSTILAATSSTVRSPRRRVDQVAQFLLTEQFSQQVAVQRQRARAALGQRRIAFVHVRGEVVEQQRFGERRGRDRLHVPDLDLAPRHSPENLAQGRQVEEIGQAFAISLDDDRERPVSTRNREQPGRSLALLPQRRTRARPAARQEQGAGGVLAEPRREHGGGTEPADDQVFDLLRAGKEQVQHRPVWTDDLALG